MSYIDTLKKANPEAYKKLESLMAYSANEGNKGVPQDWQAQIFTPLQADAPKKIETGKYVDVPEVVYDGEMVPYSTGRTIKQWVQSAPEGYTPTVVEVGGDTTQLATTGYTKDLGKINGLPVMAQYDLNGNLTGYAADPRYRNWLSGSTGVSGKWDASGTPQPAQHSSSSGGFFSGLLGGIGDIVNSGVNALGDAATWAKENPLQAAALAAGAYYGLPALAGEGAAAGGAAGLTGVDAAMADLAASSAPSFAGAAGAAGAAGGLMAGGSTGTGLQATGGLGLTGGNTANLAAMGGAQGLTTAGATGALLGETGGALAAGGIGAGLGASGLAAGTDSLLTGTAAGAAGAGALGAAAAGGAAGAAGMSELAKLGLISGGLNLAGGLLQGDTTKDALNQLATQQAALAEKTLQMGKFQPVGVTTRFGTSSFTTDPVTGAITPSYTLSPEAKAYQDALAKMTTQSLTAGQSLMNLGQGYIGESPEAVRNRYFETQLATLVPEEQQRLEALRTRQQATGRGGLAYGATSPEAGGLMATNPEMAAYYNSLAQTRRQLAANAETQYQNQVNFGTGLLNQASTPFTNVFGAQKGVELAAQQPLELSTNFANTVATRGAAQGANYATAMAPSLQAQYNAANYNPTATALQGAASNPLTGYGLMKLTGLA